MPHARALYTWSATHISLCMRTVLAASDQAWVPVLLHSLQVLLVDHDATFFSDPVALRASSPYAATGMLFFRDREQMHIPGAPLKEPPRYVRALIRRRLGWQGMLGPNKSLPAEQPALSQPPPQNDTLSVGVFEPLVWPWRPSKALLSSPVALGRSSHQIDSSVLLLSKARDLHSYFPLDVRCVVVLRAEDTPTRTHMNAYLLLRVGVGGDARQCACAIGANAAAASRSAPAARILPPRVVRQLAR